MNTKHASLLLFFLTVIIQYNTIDCYNAPEILTFMKQAGIPNHTNQAVTEIISALSRKHYSTRDNKDAVRAAVYFMLRYDLAKLDDRFNKLSSETHQLAQELEKNLVGTYSSMKQQKIVRESVAQLAEKIAQRHIQNSFKSLDNTPKGKRFLDHLRADVNRSNEYSLRKFLDPQSIKNMIMEYNRANALSQAPPTTGPGYSGLHNLTPSAPPYPQTSAPPYNPAYRAGRV